MTEIDLAKAKCAVCAQARQAALNQVQYAEEQWWREAQALPSREAVRRAVAEADKRQRAYEEAEARLRRSIADICAVGSAARAQIGDKT